MTLGLTLDRLLRTTPERLYAVWTDSAHLTRWFGVRVDAEPKLGGALAIHFWADQKPPLTGRFTHLNPYDLVGFTWMDHGTVETQVTVTFKKEGDMTRLTLRHEGFLDAKSHADHEEGWFEYLELWAIRLNVGPEDALRASASGYVPATVDVRAALAGWLGKDPAALDVSSQGDAKLFKNGQIAAHWRPSKFGTSLALTQWGFTTEAERVKARDELLGRFTAWGGKA